VVKWLTTRGDVDRARLTSQGYGFDQPISDNDTPEGRQKNRRVQFKILERSSTQKSEVEP
jgi:outer membrane protein OmpA-like peptidoglycan-associated protein